MTAAELRAHVRSKLIGDFRKQRLAEKDADARIVDTECEQLGAIFDSLGREAAVKAKAGILGHLASLPRGDGLGGVRRLMRAPSGSGGGGGGSSGGGERKKLERCTSWTCDDCSMECKSCDCKGVGAECGCRSCIAWRKSRGGRKAPKDHRVSSRITKDRFETMKRRGWSSTEMFDRGYAEMQRLSETQSSG